MSIKNYNIIGLMSGTSLDGLDVAFCNFKLVNSNWEYSIINSKTYKYSKHWKENLKNIENKSALEFVKLNSTLGKHYGNLINSFINEFNINRTNIDAIASHGHTIFHQPNLGFTTQIGNGASICATTKINTIVDFRSLDVALKGQGAPLVPIGDMMLFKEFDFCLNIGGIANISSKKNGNRVAKDITFANIISNYICSNINLEYDNRGELAKKGKIDINLLNFLDNIIDNYTKNNSSLGKEIFIKDIKPYLDNLKISNYDKLRTISEHIANKVSENILENSSVLITGGGAYNECWIELIKEKSKANITIPNNKIIDFKEALIFAFLGVLKLEKKSNCLSTVTGATKNSIGGVVYEYN